MRTYFIVKHEEGIGKPRSALTGSDADALKSKIEATLVSEFEQKEWTPLLAGIKYLSIRVTQTVIDAVSGSGIQYIRQRDAAAAARNGVSDPKMTLISETEIDRDGFIALADARTLLASTKLWHLSDPYGEEAEEERKAGTQKGTRRKKRQQAYDGPCREQWHFLPADSKFHRDPGRWKDDALAALVLNPQDVRTAWKLVGEKALVIVQGTDEVSVDKWAAEEPSDWYRSGEAAVE